MSLEMWSIPSLPGEWERVSESRSAGSLAAKFKCGNEIVCKTVVFNQPNLIWCSVSDAQFIFVF